MIEGIDDKKLTIPGYSPVCSYCRHLDRTSTKRRCKAFPNGIPLQIWLGTNRHTEPYPGDHGIRFEPKTAAKVVTPGGDVL